MPRWDELPQGWQRLVIPFTGRMERVETTMMDRDMERGLIIALLARSNDVGGRDDAAMDLGSSDSPDAVRALSSVAYDPDKNEMVAETAGESLAEIELRGNVEVPVDRTRLSTAARFWG